MLKKHISLITFLLILKFDHNFSQSPEIETIDIKESSSPSLMISDTFTNKPMTDFGSESPTTNTTTSIQIQTTPQLKNTELLIYRYTLIGVIVAFVCVCLLALLFLIKYRRLKKFRSDVAYEIGPFKSY